jgi:hypothetical protein
MDDLWDIASSPIWQDAQHQLLETVVRRLRDDDDGWGKPFMMADDDDSTALPLAKLVASFKQASKLPFDKEEIIPSWQQLPTVLELGDVSFSN